MGSAGGIVVLVDGRGDPGLVVGMPCLVPSKENVRMDEVLPGLGGFPMLEEKTKSGS